MVTLWWCSEQREMHQNGNLNGNFNPLELIELHPVFKQTCWGYQNSVKNGQFAEFLPVEFQFCASEPLWRHPRLGYRSA